MRGVIRLAVRPGVAQRASVSLASPRDTGVPLRTGQAAAATVGGIGEDVDAGPVAAASPDRVALRDARIAGAETIDAAAVDASEAGRAVGCASRSRRRRLADAANKDGVHIVADVLEHVVLGADSAGARESTGPAIG